MVSVMACVLNFITIRKWRLNRAMVCSSSPHTGWVSSEFGVKKFEACILAVLTLDIDHHY